MIWWLKPNKSNFFIHKVKNKENKIFKRNKLIKVLDSTNWSNDCTI